MREREREREKVQNIRNFLSLVTLLSQHVYLGEAGEQVISPSWIVGNKLTIWLSGYV